MADDNDHRFMQMALAQAEEAVAEGQTPFGAVVVDQTGAVAGLGHNQIRADKDPAAHGEIAALRDAWRRLGTLESLAGCTLDSSREPCLVCSFAITQFRVRRVVFAARASDVPTCKALLGADLSQAADWVNQQNDWTKLEMGCDLMRREALDIMPRLKWA